MFAIVRALLFSCVILLASVGGAQAAPSDGAQLDGSSSSSAPPPDKEMLAKRAAETGLKPGDVLNKDNWQLAEGLLPPEILKHYETGEYVNRIIDWPNGRTKRDPEFLEATEHNRGRFTVDEHGTIIDKATGKQPPYILGFPFPDIDPKDPKAGTMILWNNFYEGYYLGNIHSVTELNWVNPNGLDRRTIQDVNFAYYDGQAERYRLPNPNNYISQFLTTAVTPTDLNGTTSLTWRYRDADKRDSDWAFVPALRRVRAVSPANRSDGFLGSDMSQDDGPFFDGKVEDFTWKLVGETDQLRLVDPLSFEGKSDIRWLPGGGWRAKWPDGLKAIGYLDSNWHGVGWAPIAGGLAKRRFWVVEGVPKDKYYLYGKIQLYIDKETYQGAWNRKFSWNGELLNTLQIMVFDYHKYTRPDGISEYVQGSNMSFQCAENIKANRATIAGIQPPSIKDPPSDRKVPFEPVFFDFTTLQRFGK
jgi:hypothetical protein